jgi:hypothetical protein
MTWRPLHVELNREALRLETAAAALRRSAGSLRFHPQTGQSTPPGSEMREALRQLRDSLRTVQDRVGRLAAESAAYEESREPMAAEMRAGERRLALLRDQVGAALDLLERMLAQPERAPLDAPYGLGAPRRLHPGAQATTVAERAEALARELATQSALRANLAPGRAQTTR